MTYGNDAFRAGVRALALDAAQRAYNREMSSRVIVTPEVAAELARLSPIAGPGRALLDQPDVGLPTDAAMLERLRGLYAASAEAAAADAREAPPSDEELFRAAVMGSARMVVTPELAAEFSADPREWLRPDGFVLFAPPCGCDFCSNFGSGSQWTAEQVEDFAARARSRIMAGVDMPGRIVDDVRPDQRGGE